MNKRYQIGELAKELNLNKETIRYYEKIGILNSPKRESNGYRYYSEDDRQMLLCIRIAKEYGFTLMEIKKMIARLEEESDGCDLRHLKQFISEKINSVNHKIDELGRVKIFLEELNKNLLSE